ncbi:hypothetical protein BaRGS_00001856 [Batillaria attramentaria]|uniref:Uncharacterized protein n=1 Tax=Batillaria attramentaria TaxID=370345 RepID=A0ABD0M502_9CAEN
MEPPEERSVLDASGLEWAQSDGGDESEDVRPVVANAQETSDTGESVAGTGEIRMSLLQKLFLNAQLIGHEANTNFAQLYNVPLVSLTAVVSGPAAISLTPLLGWISDRGSNPNRRKMLNVMFCSALLVSGVFCIVLANVLHLQSLSESIKNATVEPPTLSDNDSFTTWLPLTDQNVNETGTPLKAWIGLLGYIVIDVAFQVSNAFVKSWVLTCSPRPEHTSVLELGTVMGSTGGLLTSGIATIDLEDTCFLCSAEG